MLSYMRSHNVIRNTKLRDYMESEFVAFVLLNFEFCTIRVCDKMASNTFSKFLHGSSKEQLTSTEV